MVNFNVSVDEAVKEVSKIVSGIAGIQLGEKQYSMVESRLKSRMSRLGLNTSDEYLAYLKKHEESETEALLSLMTTHHTYFFREFSHFEHILNNQLKNLIAQAEKRGDKKIRIWSAACSRGQEAYSLAMFFDFHLKLLAPHIDFEVWATDIDPESVEIAKNGVYRSDELNRSPAMYVGQHWIQGKNNVKDFSKVRDSIKSKCKFNTLNLLKIDELAAPGKFDLIFCRNVFIYFNQEQIQSITNKLVEKLSPHGCIVLGVSESLQGLKIPVEATGPSIYQQSSDLRSAPVEHVQPTPAPTAQKPLQVLCVDDSKTIHTLMKSILTLEQGFVIKHKAMNGEEALKLLQTETYDAITLDLHMPIVNGLSFLSQRKDKTPVIIVSSINREDESIAKQAIKLGALDYVEKPTVENLVNAGNEIRSKLKSVLKFNKEFRPTIKATNTSAVAKASDTLSTKPRPITESFYAKAENKKIRTLIVDDSETIRNLLNKVISADSAFEVVGLAQDAFEAERLIKEKTPDLITLDIHMPRKNGVQFLKELQSRQFIPTVMISALSEEEGPYVMDALSAGAIDYIKKPDLKELAKLTPVIMERLKTASKAKRSKFNLSRKVSVKTELDKEHITLIGSSTGGTEAVRSILESMPAEIPPIIIVQHIPAVFSKAFADRLNASLPFTVKEAVHGEEVTPNKVLIAPGGMQMGLKRSGEKLLIQITEDPVMNRHRPSVDYLFKSAADIKLEKMTAVVLTGMGADGSKEISRLKTSGAKTIAQDEATSVVYGMPKMAAATGAVDFILPLYSIAEKIIQLSEKKENKTLKKTG